MPTFVRVQDKTTGHQYDLPESAIDDAAHERLSDPDWPDLSGPTVTARPAVLAEPKSSKTASAADKKKES